MSNDPVLMAYMAKRSKTSKHTYWQRIGRAYPHDKGAGLTVILDLLPLDGRIVLLELNETDDKRLLAEAAEFRQEPRTQVRSAMGVSAGKPRKS